MVSSILATRPNRRRTTPPGKAAGRRRAPAFKHAFEPKAFYTPSEVAAILRVSSQTVLDWIHREALDAVQLSERVYRVPLGALMVKLGEPPRVKRSIRHYLSHDARADDAALAREHETASRDVVRRASTRPSGREHRRGAGQGRR